MGLIAAVTNYLFLDEPPEPADVIFLPGGPFDEPTLRAVALYREGAAPLLLPSGDRWLFQRPGVPEWERMRAVLLERGVPDGAILCETRARHTVDNARLSRRALEGAGVAARTAVICCQSFHGRRCRKAYARAFPGVRLIVCASRTRGFGPENWYRTPLGVFKACTELMKCTGLFFFLISLVRSERLRR